MDIAQYAVKGGKEYKEGKATSIEGIQVIDPQTIKITTEKVNSQALINLGGPVLSKAYYGKDYKQNTSLDYLKALYGQPIAAGPYKFENMFQVKKYALLLTNIIMQVNQKSKTLFTKSHQVILDSNYSKPVNWTIVDLEQILRI